jgi:iron complex transport system substrate-binding protein
MLAVAPSIAQSPSSDNGAPDGEAMRIVSLGGSITETVYALGAGPSVVGVDASSLYPAKAQDLPSVGYFRQVPAEGVLSLDPTVVLASADTGPPETLEQLRSAGVDVHVIEDEPTVDGSIRKIRTIGDVLGRTDAADSLVQRLNQQVNAARALRAESDSTPRVLFIYARGAGTMQVAGQGTSAAQMIELAGGENAVTGFDGFKPMSAESVAAAHARRRESSHYRDGRPPLPRLRPAPRRSGPGTNTETAPGASDAFTFNKPERVTPNGTTRPSPARPRHV